MANFCICSVYSFGGLESIDYIDLFIRGNISGDMDLGFWSYDLNCGIGNFCLDNPLYYFDYFVGFVSRGDFFRFSAEISLPRIYGNLKGLKLSGFLIFMMWEPLTLSYTIPVVILLIPILGLYFDCIISILWSSIAWFPPCLPESGMKLLKNDL